MDKPKFQHSFKVGSSIFVFCADDSTSMEAYLNKQAELFADAMHKLESVISKISQPKVPNGTPGYSTPTLNGECDGEKHPNVKPISGNKNGKHWEARVCNDCDAISFKNHTKDGREFWTKWKVKGEKKEAPTKSVYNNNVDPNDLPF